MDVQKELKEFREMNTKVAQLEAQGANSMQIRRAMQMPVKPGESDLAYQARVLIYSYASDFLQAAEAGGVKLSLTVEDAELVAQAVGCAYEANRGHRGLEQEDNLVLISKELGCYLAGGRAINTIEVANRVVRSIQVGDTGLTLNQRPILRLLVDRKG